MGTRAAFNTIPGLSDNQPGLPDSAPDRRPGRFLADRRQDGSLGSIVPNRRLGLDLALSDSGEIDIDDGAIAHAQENAKLNGLDCSFGKKVPTGIENPLILMNMISSEQKVAWQALPKFDHYRLIVSGYPREEKEPQFDGALIEKHELEGWRGYSIKKDLIYP